MIGIELIEEERIRQVNEEGWTDRHDDQYYNGELTDAGDAYLKYYNAGSGTKMPRFWPWEESWWKPSEDPCRNLVKAGALYKADVDRLNRIAVHYEYDTQEWLNAQIKIIAQMLDKLNKNDTL